MEYFSKLIKGRIEKKKRRGRNRVWYVEKERRKEKESEFEDLKEDKIHSKKFLMY